jgi:hypothetical protein
MGAEPPVRARDPDSTGGYYQPVRAAGPGVDAIGAVRLVCALATAPPEVAADLRRRYQANQNPQLGELTALLDGQPVPMDALPPDRSVTLVARWAASSAEQYLAFDPGSQAIRERRESMRVSWFVTAGTIENHHTGRSEDDPETSVSTTWQPPTHPTAGERVHLWAVLRDSRGGASAVHRELVLRTASGPVRGASHRPVPPDPASDPGGDSLRVPHRRSWSVSPHSSLERATSATSQLSITSFSPDASAARARRAR